MNTKDYLFVAAAVALAATPILAKPLSVPKQNGTSILHFFVREGMVNEQLEGPITNAVGRVDVKQNQQGKANNQRLDITAAQLEPNTTYQLLAVLGDNTNYTYVTDFLTSTNGKAALRFVRVGSSQNPNAGVGQWKSPLPAVLDPISNIRALTVANGSTQAVLTADLTAPDKLAYLIKRWMENGPAYTNAAAELRLMATTNKVQLRLRAYGLEPGAAYLLAVNGSVVDTSAADLDGKLSFTNLPVNPVDILLVRELAIWDSVSNNILSTRLP